MGRRGLPKNKYIPVCLLLPDQCFGSGSKFILPVWIGSVWWQRRKLDDFRKDCIGIQIRLNRWIQIKKITPAQITTSACTFGVGLLAFMLSFEGIRLIFMFERKAFSKHPPDSPLLTTKLSWSGPRADPNIIFMFLFAETSAADLDSTLTSVHVSKFFNRLFII